MVAQRCSHNEHFMVIADDEGCKHYFHMLEPAAEAEHCQHSHRSVAAKATDVLVCKGTTL